MTKQAGIKTENIKVAAKIDLNKIEQWLRKEYEKEGQGFFSNKDIVIDNFYKNQLFVYIINNFPVGFITGPFDGPSILNVNKDFQGIGVGTRLFEYILNKAIKNKIDVIKIQCKPETSVGFWEKMGFTIHEKHEHSYGYMIIEYKNNILSGEKIKVVINTYSEDNDEEVLSTYEPIAFLNKNKSITLAERLFLFEKTLFEQFGKDLIVSVVINGEEIYKDKAKREKAKDIGINKSRHDYGYFIDNIKLNS